MLDAYSRWPEAIKLASTTATKTIEVMRNLFASYRLPEELVSDNGPQFTAVEFGEFLQLNAVKHTKSTLYNPSSNGAAERLVQTFKQSLEKGKL